ncbi:response regulator [Natranaerofaba carboxydovora]|uniref:response regulator n=1 Tax=Natranaerofaba carboxydovora TaxID=2742683 RepID=UPI001F142859|nr:response regulator [Natranaerofaba carboxydovora]UMZ75157.1 Transcriptional regulatory protein WalR [Natranaerofaba carboxydovora]
MSRILIIEDEKPIADIIQFNLENEGYKVITAFNGEEGVNKFREEDPDLIVLDLMLPDKDGLTACKEIRKESVVPILVLTAKDSEVDRVIGLEMGADDYVTKPFSNRELLARVKAILRRVDYGNKTEDKREKNVVKIGDIRIDFKKAVVEKNGEAIELTNREFKLLSYFVNNRGEILTRDRLLDHVWGYEYLGDDRTVDVTIRRLREKVEDDPGSPSYIITKRGMGYYFRRTENNA